MIDEYLSLEPLETRIAIHRGYSEHASDVEQDTLDALGSTAGIELLDVGCGTGSFLRRLRGLGHTTRLVGLDSSPAAVDGLRDEPGIEVYHGDAADLPFEAGTFTAVTARHMLYHVDDLGAAISEAHRVLRPGSRFAAVVNHRGALSRIIDLVRRVLATHGVAVPEHPVHPVYSDNLPGSLVEVFGNVDVTMHHNALVFPEPTPLVRYAVAILGMYGLPPDAPQRRDVVSDLEAEATHWFATHGGPWSDEKGYAVCTAIRHP
jgi:SAM-dependent methyltransferase